MKKSVFNFVDIKGLILTILSLLSFVSSIFFSIFTFDSSFYSFASFLVNQRQDNGLSFTYGTVKNENLSNYQTFFYNADDITGVDYKKITHTAFRVLNPDNNEDDYIPIQINETKTNSKLLLYTTWNFNRFNYDFDISPKMDNYNLEKDEVYITETIASKLNLPDNPEIISGTKIVINEKESKIKGIIKNESINVFSNIYGTDFVLGNYNLRHFANFKHVYDFILFGNEINTTTSLHCIEDSIKIANKLGSNIHTSYYYDYNESEHFYLGNTQLIMLKTFSDNNKTFPSVVSLTFLILSVSLIIFYLTSNCYKIRKIRDKNILRKNSCIISFLAILFAYLFVLIFQLTLDLFIVDDVVISLQDYNIFTFSFVFWIVLSLLVYVIESKKEKSMCGYFGIIKTKFCSIRI